MRIHVHTSTDTTTLNYVAEMWRTMQLLANQPDLLTLSTHIIGRSVKGSDGHASAAQAAISSLEHDAINIISDSDTVICMQGWDDVLRARLTGCFGTTYEDIGGPSAGIGSVQTYKKIPNLVWFAMAPQYDWTTLQLAPRMGQHVAVDTEEKSKIYNLPVGFQTFCDVGWQVPQYLHDRQIPYEGMRQIKPKDADAIVLQGLSNYHEEYHLDGKPFLLHHRGSRKHAYRSPGMSADFYSAFDRWLADQ